MHVLPRLLICLVALSLQSQSWAAPMLCGGDTDISSAGIEQSHATGHAHHVEMEEVVASDEMPADDCGSDCDCTECVTTAALSPVEFTPSSSIRIELTSVAVPYLGPDLETILRPPIRS
jgi:hypothetical protein